VEVKDVLKKVVTGTVVKNLREVLLINVKNVVE
jgi:hypothetical protein